MEMKELDGILYREMLTGGARYLGAHAAVVNDLNVFPIPDGDTGDNMHMTVSGGVTSAEKSETKNIGEMAKAAASGMLLAARGNSGVILSQFFGGIAKGLEGLATADTEALGRAFRTGVRQAYAAVVSPTEGTILTVAREATEYAANRLSGDSTPNSFFADLIDEMHRSLDRTPELLPVLKAAGVIDSGGAGLIYIIEGMNKILRGETVEDGATHAGVKTVDTSSFTADTELEFGYCTEFLLQLQNRKVNPETFDVKALADRLSEMGGESIVALKEGSIVKIHVHTMDPGEVLTYCRTFGEFLTLKIENMMLQHSEATIENRYSAKKPAVRKDYAVVAVASGSGIAETFRSLGADAIVSGGQTMNPSSEDFLCAFRELSADHILVFPNNGNIILAAEQAAKLYTDADVRVIPSHTIGDGYAALSMLDTANKDADTVVAELCEAMEGVVTASVTRAVRDSNLSGLSIHTNDYIGIVGKDILSDATTAVLAAKEMLSRTNISSHALVMGIAGKDATAEDCAEIRAFLAQNYPLIEYYEIDGGQDVYNFIFVLE